MNTKHSRALIWIACTYLLLFATPSYGTWWTHDPNEIGDWYDPSNWSAGLPSHVAYINNGGTAHISGSTTSVSTAYVGYDSSSTNRVIQTGNGVLGSTSTYQYLRLGEQSGTHGEYDLSGNSQLTAGQIRIGDRGYGVFRQSGGIVNASIATAMDFSASGLHEMSGGTLDAPYFEMGAGETANSISRVVMLPPITFMWDTHSGKHVRCSMEDR